jgi:hypothetical protein
MLCIQLARDRGGNADCQPLSQHLRLACRAKALIGADREPIKKIVPSAAAFFPQKKLASYAKRFKRP